MPQYVKSCTLYHCWIYTTPFLLYVFPIRPSLINFLKWNANLLFLGFRFSLINIIFEFVRPIEELSMDLNPFLLRRASFAYFRLKNRIIVFFELFLDFQTRWEASISWNEAFTSIFCNSSLTFSSSFLSSTIPWTLVISGLFHRLYCSSRFPFFSRTFFSRLFNLLRNR